ncbi:MAG: TetR/AcrR family transcriptional regulator [Novosphingobium sp.]|nr:MAG: TetR/AcrR family transcriptional regulator [Novosphingobium sp.]
MAVTPRRVGAENSATRALILEATEQLIRDEGYAAVSTRRVAAKAGLKPSLVHYYFTTTDDLLLAVSRHGAEHSDRMIEEALLSDDPIRALWAYLTDTSRIAIALEFMALANHRKAVRAHMAEHCEAMRQREVEIFTKLLGERLAGPDGVPPAGLSLVLAGIGRALVMEGGLGVTSGHDEARAFVEQWLDKLAPPLEKSAELAEALRQG